MGARAARLLVPALLCAALALYLAACNAVPFGQYVDDVQWLLYAEGLLKGSGLKAWHPFPVPELSLTWGTPALLMPALALFGRDILLLKGVFAAAFFAGLVLFFLATRRGFEGARLPAYLLLLFFCDFLLPFAGSIMSEAPYLLLFGASVLLLFERLRSGDDRPGEWALLGAFCGVLAVTRVMGGLLACAVLAELCVSRRFRAAASFGVCAALCAAPYALHAVRGVGPMGFYGIYWEPLLREGAFAALRAAGEGLWFYLKGLSCLSFLYLPAFAPSSPWVKAPAVLLCLGLVGAGIARGLRDPGRRVLALYLLAYLAVCCAYPYREPRYVVPLYPVFLLFLCEGVLALPARAATRGLCALAVLSLASNLPGLARTARSSLSQPPEAAHAAYDWLRAHSAEGELIVSTDAARIFFFTGRKGLLTVPGGDAEAFSSAFRTLKARYLVIEGEGFVPVSPGMRDPTRVLHGRNAAAAGDARFFRQVHEERAEGVRIYETSAAAAQRADASAMTTRTR